MARSFTKIQSRAIAAGLIIAGAWCLYKPVVSVAWLIKTGELPVLLLRRRDYWLWFESFVPPWSVDGFKSWIAYALLVIAGAGLWTLALGLLADRVPVRRILGFLLYSIYALVAAVVVLVLIEWRIL